MKTRVAIRPLSVADQAAFVSAARASFTLHAPWVTAPTDAVSFKRYVARFDGVSNFGFVVYLPSTGEVVGAINLTHVIFGAFRSGYLGYFAFAGFEG